MSKIPPERLIALFAQVVSDYASEHANFPFHILSADIQDLNHLFANFKSGDGQATAAILGRLWKEIRNDLPKSITDYIYANA